MWYKKNQKKKPAAALQKQQKQTAIFFFSSPDSIIEIPTLRNTATGLRSGNQRPAQICQLGLKVQKNANVHQVQLNRQTDNKTTEADPSLIFFSHSLEERSPLPITLWMKI